MDRDMRAVTQYGKQAVVDRSMVKVCVMHATRPPDKLHCSAKTQVCCQSLLAKMETQHMVGQTSAAVGGRTVASHCWLHQLTCSRPCPATSAAQRQWPGLPLFQTSRRLGSGGPGSCMASDHHGPCGESATSRYPQPPVQGNRATHSGGDISACVHVCGCLPASKLPSSRVKA
jgi:hypothetical protein